MTTPAIVWIHGFPLSSRVFSKQMSIAARHVTPDLAGFGAAPPPRRDYSMDDYGRDVLAALDQLGIERAVFAGLSMGGYICFAIARLAPGRMEGLILIDTREMADTAEGKRGRYEAIEKVKEKGVSVVADSMLPKMLTPSAPPGLVEEARQIMMTSSAEGVAAALRAMAGRPDSSDTLRRVEVPALVVVGDSDTITTPEDAERMAKTLRRATVATIRGAAHLSNLEQPEQFNSAVASFLANDER
ncbi:MAG TPA: alpha/beta hydrolase [Thermoanaerobaculia bacterium]|nr:alpha/beta hydrolase [Thermoanaerobaculia bacterium]